MDTIVIAATAQFKMGSPDAYKEPALNSLGNDGSIKLSFYGPELVVQFRANTLSTSEEKRDGYARGFGYRVLDDNPVNFVALWGPNEGGR